jgi:NitT/TauT family transport system substrate-binding protein
MKTNSRISTLLHILLLVSVLILASGCASSTPTQPAEPPTEVSVRLKWTHQVQFSGIYLADSEGYYAAENLKVTVDPVDFNEIESVKKVMSGQNTFGVASADEIIAARSQGLPVKAIAVIFRISPLVLMSIDDVKLNSPQDLIGKRVGVHAGQAYTVYSALLNQTGIDPAQIDYSEAKAFDVLECLKTVDVCTAYTTDGVVSAQMKGHEVSMILPGDYGVPFYADVVFTTDDYIAQHPDIVERFLRATLKGWQVAIENKEKAADAALKYDPNLDRDFQIRSMTATIPLVTSGNLPIGVMEDNVWKLMYDILLQQKVIKEFDITTAYTKEFMDKIVK